MSTPSLANCWAKLNRAEEQLRVLNAQLKEYVEGKPYDISDQPELRGTLQLWRYRNVKPAPLRFGVMVGEIVHNMRSALDHLVWQLVLLNQKKPYLGNQFPIYERRLPDLANPRVPNWTRGSVGKLQGVSVKHQEIIESLQPYHRRHRAQFHPLAVLNELWNTDKHRVIHTATLATPESVFPSTIGVDTGGYAGVQAKLHVSHGPVEESAEALGIEILATPWGTPKRVNVEGEFPIQVEFGEARVRTRDLHRIGGFIVRKALNRFAREFREPVKDHPLAHEPVLDTEFVRAPEGVMGVHTPESSPKVIGRWRVWFDAYRIHLGDIGQGVAIPPAWYFRSEAEGDREHFIVEAQNLTTEVLRDVLGRRLTEDEVREFFDYFEPAARTFVSPDGTQRLTFLTPA